MTVKSSAKGERFVWLDIARGIGIIFVVIGHALGGLIDSPLGMGQVDLRRAFFVIYVFHMPLLFILSGAMVAQRIESDRAKFAANLLLDLVWPYFLWSVVQFTIIYAIGGLANQRVNALWPTLRFLPIMPISQFWFLYALFFLHGTSIFFYRMLGRDGFLLFCLALKPLSLLIWMPFVVRLIANQAPWYGIGVYLAAPGIFQLIVSRPAVVRCVVFPIVAAGLLHLTLIAEPGFAPTANIATAQASVLAGLTRNYLVFPAALMAALAVVGIAGANFGKFGPWLAFLGRRSMPIFILHIIGIAGTRILLTKAFHITDPYLIMPVIVSVGLVMPLAVFSMIARLGWTRRLGLGRP